MSYLDLFEFQRDEIDYEEMEELKGQYKDEIDMSAFHTLYDALGQYGAPTQDNDDFPDEKQSESFVMLDSDIHVRLRLTSEGGNIVNLLIRADIPGEYTESEALTQALIESARSIRTLSNIEAGLYDNNSDEISVRGIWAT